RFLTVDPIQGGCANTYAYVFGDPLNTHDLSGQSSCQKKCPYLTGNVRMCPVHSAIPWRLPRFNAITIVGVVAAVAFAAATAGIGSIAIAEAELALDEELGAAAAFTKFEVVTHFPIALLTPLAASLGGIALVGSQGAVIVVPKTSSPACPPPPVEV